MEQLELFKKECEWAPEKCAKCHHLLVNEHYLGCKLKQITFSVEKQRKIEKWMEQNEVNSPVSIETLKEKMNENTYGYNKIKVLWEGEKK